MTRSVGGTMLAKPTAAIAAMPVNEPCYSHSSCRGYDQATSMATAGSGFVCCVKWGTCDAQVSNNAKYFEGGCLPFHDGTHPLGAHSSDNVRTSKKRGVSNESVTSTWATAATTTPGCFMQGECVLPYAEQIMHWTAGPGSGMEAAAVPDAVMDRLLVGAVEAYPDACREIYPRTAVTATHHVKASITIEAEIATFTTTVLTAMEAKVAREMKVAPGNVDIKAEGGSVVLTINIGYDSAVTAASASTTMAAAMSDKSAAATMLTTDLVTFTTAEVSAVPVITSGSGASAPAPPPPAAAAATAPPPSTPKKTDDTMSVGAIAGIAVGASVVVILVAGVALFMMNKSKKQVTSTKG